jgi:hypothetical protein
VQGEIRGGTLDQAVAALCERGRAGAEQRHRRTLESYPHA